MSSEPEPSRLNSRAHHAAAETNGQNRLAQLEAENDAHTRRGMVWIRQLIWPIPPHTRWSNRLRNPRDGAAHCRSTTRPNRLTQQCVRLGEIALSSGNAQFDPMTGTDKA